MPSTTRPAFRLDGEPLCTVCLITQSEAAALAKEQELTKAGLTAWYDQIQ